MPRKSAVAPMSNAVATPHQIHPTTLYWLPKAVAALQVTKEGLAREVRLGRLRSGKRAGKVYFLGKWLLEWLEGGERKRQDKADARGV